MGMQLHTYTWYEIGHREVSVVGSRLCYTLSTFTAGGTKYFTGFQIMDITTPTIETLITAPTKTPTIHIYQAHEFSKSIGKLNLAMDLL